MTYSLNVLLTKNKDVADDSGCDNGEFLVKPDYAEDFARDLLRIPSKPDNIIVDDAGDYPSEFKAITEGPFIRT